MSSPNLPDHCTPTSELLNRISSLFEICIPTPLAFFSTLLGIFSIVSWLFAQLPQIVKNYKLGSAAGLSVFFLTEWLLGDMTNLLGAVLTHQASWQVVVASYYVSVDVALVSQYLWYSRSRRVRKEEGGRRYGSGNKGQQNEDSSDVLVGISPVHSANGISDDTGDGKKPTRTGKETTKDTSDSPNEPQDVRNNSVWSTTFSFSGEKSSDRIITHPSKSPPSPIPSPKTLLLTSILLTVLTQASPLRSSPQILDNEIPSNPSEFAGRILSWCSTLLYLGSRLPQIYKNHTRRSTAGLSPTLFIAAFFGNLFYSSSLLTNPLVWSSYPPYGAHGWVGHEGSNRATWIALAAPFWLGAAGVLALDAAVGVQFLIFGEGAEPKVVVTQDARGRSHWKKVSGWMRGWVPSPSPAPTRRSPLPETGRLLGGSERENGGGRYGGV